ncbi:MAG: Holliday junction resolvase RuvX [Opitutales bacterium]
MRLLGIDYGEKRIGLAYADELGLAVPIPPAAQADEPGRLAAIAREVDRRRVETVVVGYPYNMDGSVGFKAREVDAFIERLGAVVSCALERQDERLTTHAAQRGLEATGRAGKRDRRVRASGEVDSRAAALILQDYIDAHDLAPPSLLEPGEEDGW